MKTTTKTTRFNVITVQETANLIKPLGGCCCCCCCCCFVQLIVWLVGLCLVFPRLFAERNIDRPSDFNSCVYCLICIFLYLCMVMFVCLFVCLCVCVSICLSVCLCLCVCKHACIFVCACILYVYIHNMFVYMCACTHARLHTGMYVHLRMFEIK